MPRLADNRPLNLKLMGRKAVTAVDQRLRRMRQFGSHWVLHWKSRHTHTHRHQSTAKAAFRRFQIRNWSLPGLLLHDSGNEPLFFCRGLLVCLPAQLFVVCTFQDLVGLQGSTSRNPLVRRDAAWRFATHNPKAIPHPKGFNSKPDAAHNRLHSRLLLALGLPRWAATPARTPHIIPTSRSCQEGTSPEKCCAEAPGILRSVEVYSCLSVKSYVCV